MPTIDLETNTATGEPTITMTTGEGVVSVNVAPKFLSVDFDPSGDGYFYTRTPSDDLPLLEALREACEAGDAMYEGEPTPEKLETMVSTLDGYEIVLRNPMNDRPRSVSLMTALLGKKDMSERDALALAAIWGLYGRRKSLLRMIDRLTPNGSA